MLPGIEHVFVEGVLLPKLSMYPNRPVICDSMCYHMHDAVFACNVMQVNMEVQEVNAKFARLHGTAGGTVLDLYGRNAAPVQTAAPLKTQPTNRHSDRVSPFRLRYYMLSASVYMLHASK